MRRKLYISQNIIANMMAFILSGFFPTVILSATCHAQPFQFGLMGDTGYTQKGLAEFDNLVRAVNRETSLSFVIHIGDFEIDGGAWTRKPDGPMPCTDESYNRNLEVFNSVEVPFIYTPGDNDWTDCSKLPAGRFGSVERL